MPLPPLSATLAAAAAAAAATVTATAATATPASVFLRPRVQNVVATCTCGTALYLPGLARALRFVEYNPSRFSAVTVRLARPRATALVFSSGKIVCTGTKSALQARWALLKFLALLRTRCHVPHAHLYGFCVQNMVASVDVGHRLHLARFQTAFAAAANYEPRLFPGLIYRAHATQGVVALVFASGRIVLTGAKHVDVLRRACTALVPRLAVAHPHAVPVFPLLPTPPTSSSVSPATNTVRPSTEPPLNPAVQGLLASLVREGVVVALP